MGLKKIILVIGLVVLWAGTSTNQAWAVKVQDSAGRTLYFAAPPDNIVSLVPTATEIIYALGEQERVKGLTYHDLELGKIKGKTIVGGFARPDLQRVIGCNPDLVILSSWQDIDPSILAPSQIFFFDPQSISQGLTMIKTLGKILGKNKKAQELVQTNLDLFALIKQKVSTIPFAQRKRVVRLMGRDKVMTPGDDSFQNELIKAAGGIPPKWGKQGNLVQPDPSKWQEFDPQVIYGCGQDRELARIFKQNPGWGKVEAVQQKRIFYFPCQLTCRPGINMGYFVAWLASMLYPEHFANPRELARPEKTYEGKPLSLPLPYVRQARILKNTIFDFTNKTLVIEFSRPQKVISTLEGQRSNILWVGNHFSPPPCWSLGHRLGLTDLRRHIYQVLNLPAKKSSFLFTGADMDNLALSKAKFREMEIIALVTAGVRSNALRMSTDTGNYYEPGTINMIILTNMQLSPRAMTRAIISATEAKSAALADLDIRSSATPLLHQATGTGTDNIIVVQGIGARIDNSGGHSKMGELIARTVYQGVVQAIYKQNKIYLGRPVLARLNERHLSPYSLTRQWTKEHWSADQPQDAGQLMGRLEAVLLRPRYQGFVQSLLSLSDQYTQGQLQDLNALQEWCLDIASSLAGYQVSKIKTISSLPPVLAKGLGAILTGLDAQ